MSDAPTLRLYARALETGRARVDASVERALDGHVPAWAGYRQFDRGGAQAQAVALEATRAAGGALGPLAGRLLSVKDLYGVAGFRTHAGTLEPLPLSFAREGPLVRGLRRAGAIVSGKTRTVPLAFGALGVNEETVTPANPSDPDRVPGGSSSGAAVSLREGTAHVALGSDTAGSIRIPASWCGLVGFMPARGRWSTDGMVPLSRTLDSPGVMTRFADDARFVFDLIEGREDRLRADARVPALADARLVVVEDPFLSSLSDAVGDVFEAALRRLEAEGGRVARRRSPAARAAVRLFDAGTVTAAEAHAFVRHRAPFMYAHLGRRVQRALDGGAELTAATYQWRRRRLDVLAGRARRELSTGEIWVAPTTPTPPPRRDEVEGDEAYGRADRPALANTGVANTLGMCAVSLPAGRDRDGLPVGLMLMAPAGAEARLLDVAVAAEAALGGAPPSEPRGEAL